MVGGWGRIHDESAFVDSMTFRYFPFSEAGILGGIRRVDVAI